MSSLLLDPYDVMRLLTAGIAFLIDIVDMIYTQRFKTFYLAMQYIGYQILSLVAILLFAKILVFLVQKIFTYFFGPFLESTQGSSVGSSQTSTLTPARTTYMTNISDHLAIHVLIIIFALLRLIYISYNITSLIFNLFVLSFYLYQLIAHILSIAQISVPQFMKAQHIFEILYLIAAAMVFSNVAFEYGSVLSSQGIIFPRHMIFFELYDFCGDVIFSLYGIYISTNNYFVSLPDLWTNLPIGLLYVSYALYVYNFKTLAFLMIFVATFFAQHNFYPYLPKPNNEDVGYDLEIMSVKERQDKNITAAQPIIETIYESK